GLRLDRPRDPGSGDRAGSARARRRARPGHARALTRVERREPEPERLRAGSDGPASTVTPTLGGECCPPPSASTIPRKGARDCADSVPIQRRALHSRSAEPDEAGALTWVPDDRRQHRPPPQWTPRRPSTPRPLARPALPRLCSPAREDVSSAVDGEQLAAPRRQGGEEEPPPGPQSRVRAKRRRDRRTRSDDGKPHDGRRHGAVDRAGYGRGSYVPGAARHRQHRRTETLAAAPSGARRPVREADAPRAVPGDEVPG